MVFNLKYGDCDISKCLLYSLLSATLMCILLVFITIYIYKKISLYAQETYHLSDTASTH